MNDLLLRYLFNFHCIDALFVGVYIQGKQCVCMWTCKLTTGKDAVGVESVDAMYFYAENMEPWLSDMYK